MEDCYYFIYSLCTKKNCIFRHSNAAKKNLILCKTWSIKKKCKIDCPFRHSDYHLKKDRKEIYCYWEETESGCQKEFCNFKHKNPAKDLWKQIRIRNIDEIRKSAIAVYTNIEHVNNIDPNNNFNSVNQLPEEKEIIKNNKQKNVKNISSDLQKELELIDKLLEEEGMSFSQNNFQNK